MKSAFVALSMVFASACTGTLDAPGSVRDRPSASAGAPGLDTPEANTPPLPSAPTTCGDQGANSLVLLSTREYANSLREIFRGARVPDELFPSGEQGTPLDSSARTLERIDQEVGAIVSSAIADPAAWLGCTPAGLADSECLERMVREVGLRIWRRPLADDELQQSLGLLSRLTKEQGLTFADAFSVVARALVQSPDFIYHLELPAGQAPSVGTFEVSLHALASRLSYFLWQSPPDAELLEAATRGTLGETPVLSSQIHRMLADPRAQGSLSDWFEVWLGTEGIGQLSKNQVTYPEFGPELQGEMRAETRAFFGSILGDQGGRVSALFDADWTVAGPLVAKLYGAAHPGTGATRIALDTTERAGVLTHASVLSVHGSSIGSHPVKRGLLVRTRLLCQQVPPPPPDVDTSIKQEDLAAGASTRQIFAAHVESPTCAACHSLIDPIGFGFEHYDGLGRYRKMDGTHPVDARGELIGTDVDGPFVGAIELAKRLASSKAVAACATTRLYQSAHRRVGDPADGCRVDRIVDSFTEDPTIADIVLKVLSDPSIKSRRAPADR